MSMIDAALTGYIRNRPRRQFDWADNSCAHFTGSWWYLNHGVNPMSEIPLSDLKSALRYLNNFEGSLISAVSSVLNREAQPWACLYSGDITLINTPGHGVGQALGICTGMRSAFLSEEGECHFCMMGDTICGWKLHA